MGKGGKEGVGIRGQIHTCGTWFEIEDGANEGRVLV